jgi:hypothetical protein
MTTKQHSPSLGQRLQRQYEAWPYPQVPLLASLPSTHPWELHVSWLWDRSGSGPAPARPRIWIAGCGTFEPYLFSVANPAAEILATDFSRTSLAIAARRCSVHRRRNVRFAPVDLADESTWPDGEFDLVECYGVLMNLADPAGVLARLRTRLTARGVLRLMVYPQYSRSRVFQLQRLARLLGLHAGERSHPKRLRRFVQQLPAHHPLRWAFANYADSRNDAGVVDAFLHGGDRGFTAFQLGSLLRDAGLAPAHWFHRPWAQPDRMAERLQLTDRSQSFVLNYLDLWQELRGNFVVCCRRADAPPRVVQPPTSHPSFRGEDQGLRHRLRLLRLGTFGGRVPSRTGDGEVVLVPAAARALRQPDAATHAAALGAGPLVLGAGATASTLPPHADFAGEAAFLIDQRSLAVGERAPNPLYAHLFAAFELAIRHPELGLPDLDRQLTHWLPWADPLEAAPLQWGLTPYATAQRLADQVHRHLERGRLPTAADYAAVRLRNDPVALGRVRTLLAAHPELPAVARDDAELRELFVLLFGHDSLFLTLEPR